MGVAGEGLGVWSWGCVGCGEEEEEEREEGGGVHCVLIFNPMWVFSGFGRMDIGS